MAIGDSILPRRGNVQPYTPEMRNSGVRLIPSAPTTPARGQDLFRGFPGVERFEDLQGMMRMESDRMRAPTMGIPQSQAQAQGAGEGGASRDLFGAFPGVERFEDLQRMMRMESDRMRAGAAPVAGPSLTPDDVRPVNPFNPSERIRPEDDALTPEGMLAPSEIKDTGGALSKLGDFLTNPAHVKLLASLGMALNPTNTVLGEFAFGQAEATAQNRFRQGLEAGQQAGDVLSPGLSAEGRRTVMQDFERREEAQQAQDRQQFEAETRRGQAETSAAQEMRLSQREPLTQQQMEVAIEQGTLENEVTQRALDRMDASTPGSVAREGARALGINLPEGLNLEGYTPDMEFDLVQELAATRRTQITAGARQSKSGVPELSEAMRQVAIKDRGRRLSEARAAYSSAETGTERNNALNKINQISEDLIEAGGDPADWTADGPTGSTQPGGVEKIMQFTGFSRARVMEMAPEEKAQWLKSWNQADFEKKQKKAAR